MSVVVALDGPDGAGKSTLVGGILEWARRHGRSARTVAKWDVFDDGAVPEARFLRGSSREDLRVCIAEMPLPARMLFLGWMNATAAHRARAAAEDLVVLDGYWVKHAATELAMGCPAEVVDAITASIAPVDLLVYVDVSPEEALRRKRGDLTPYECGMVAGCDPSRFLAHQAAVRRLMADWARGRSWPVIAAGSAAANLSQLEGLVEPLLRR